MQRDALTINAWIEKLSTQTVNGRDVLWAHITVVYRMAAGRTPMWNVPVCFCLDLTQQTQPQGSGLHVTADIWLQQPATRHKVVHQPASGKNILKINLVQ
jgi:hypothetical protein